MKNGDQNFTLIDRLSHLLCLKNLDKLYLQKLILRLASGPKYMTCMVNTIFKVIIFFLNLTSIKFCEKKSFIRYKLLYVNVFFEFSTNAFAMNLCRPSKVSYKNQYSSLM